MAILRAVFRQHNRSPEPGSITLLAPHHKDGMDKMHFDLQRATRFVTFAPLGAEILGAELAVEMNKGAYRAIANPWCKDCRAWRH